MAGTVPTGFQFTTMPDAGPVHCNVDLGMNEGDASV
jgi:hypothetical protein